MEIISAVVIAVAIVIGVGAHYITKKNDSPAEQIAESVLHAKGIDIDFSADDKQEDNNKAQTE